MIQKASPLTHHLNTLVAIFSCAPSLADGEFIEIDKASAMTVLKKLELLSKQAATIELELSILRHEEAEKQIADTVEQMATSELSTLLDAAHGNVIRPSFGGKRHD